MTARQIQASVNRTLRLSGYAARLKQGNGYSYFYGRTVEGWFSTSVMTCYLTDMTPDQWVQKFEKMKAEHDRQK